MSRASSPDRPHSPSLAQPSLAAIGNFDGVHRGHFAVLAHLAEEATREGLAPRVLTFDPPPQVVLGRTPPAVLTPLERKIELIEAAVPGVRVVVRKFDRQLADLTPEQFAEDVLVGELAARRVVVGQNFRFGRGRVGDLEALQREGARLGFAAGALEIAGDERGAWSSTRVRQSLAAGDFADVAAVLGRPHALTGTVVHGAKRGRTLGFPTANLGDIEEVLPPFGVYAVLVDRLDLRPRALAVGVANIGIRPSVGGGQAPSVEAHLLDFHPQNVDEGDLYGTRLRLHLVSFLRGERKFDGLDALRSQIAVDVIDARQMLAGHVREARQAPASLPRTTDEPPTPKNDTQSALGGWY